MRSVSEPVGRWRPLLYHLLADAKTVFPGGEGHCTARATPDSRSQNCDTMRLAPERVDHEFHERGAMAAEARGHDKPEDLAVAVELKFLLPLLIEGKADPDPADKRPLQIVGRDSQSDKKACQKLAYDAIAETIRNSGHDATTSFVISTQNSAERAFWETHWIVKKANSAEPGPDEKKKSRGHYVWVGVELSSPKLRACDNNTQTRLSEVFRALLERHRLVANYTCDVHVHLGRFDGSPYTLSTLKRLGSFLWAAEPTVRSIRNPLSPNYENVYTWGAEMRRYSRLASAVSKSSQSSLDAEAVVDDGVKHVLSSRETNVFPQDRLALCLIWQAKTHCDLGQLLSGPTKQYRRLGFNFGSFGLEDERSHISPRTVEFRIMEGTDRRDMILGWVVICCRIVEVAMKPSDHRYVAALRRLLCMYGGDKQEGEGAKDALGARRGREFAALMKDLDLPRSVYGSFEEKVIRENIEWTPVE